MTKYESLVENTKKSICNTYGRYPVDITKAKGSRLWDLEGREYIDLLSGISVVNLGHCREDLADVMAEQARKLVHVSNLFYQEEQVECAEKLLATCDADKVFFSNSGAEANEAAIKLARKYMRTVKNRDAYEIITLEGSFHGRTLATLTATGQTGPIKNGFSPLPEGFSSVPVGNIEAMSAAVSGKTAAIMVEMVQGEGGIKPLAHDYVQEIVALVKEKDILLIVDEVQSGLCRTGKWWAHQHYGITPDIFTSAKALANGLPMGAMLATDEVAKGFTPGSHATTFGGSALVSKVSSKVLDIMTEEKLADRAAEMGDFFISEALKLKDKYPGKIVSVRGLGLMLGIELGFDGNEVFSKLRDKGFILNLTKGIILRLLPALTIERADLVSFLNTLDEILAEMD
ncbi:aspartate aminotransferase family protein [Maridesulfovibrio ferrireducens]|uniref:aspartate aminotransferase family protein n=1 Tax=Maridesulfovibrio ferrireducens TaxID=246191 RepID=UPI001A1BF5D7|nr:aspartate aminotransferase family protein [Maridesulfovibrio ferrireducens]MBI9110418.1 aspartate aminotransferase family protein [Maridesulfovibrio ferrireducens]